MPAPKPPTSAEVEAARAKVRASIDRPSVGRVYDYLVGGNNNFPIDKDFAEQQLAIFPDLRTIARTNRAFLQRAVRTAIKDHGIRQFVDFGSGLPTTGNVHETADSNMPFECKVIYIDNDDLAHAHAMTLLADTSDLTRHYALAGDFLDSEAMWAKVLRSGYVNPEKPTCLLTVALLHFMPPELEPERHLAYYRDQLAPGSLLTLSHICDELNDPAFDEVRRNYDSKTTNRATFRTRPEITNLFGDYELLEPGVTWAPQWRPNPKLDRIVMKDCPEPEDPARSRILVGVGYAR